MTRPFHAALGLATVAFSFTLLGATSPLPDGQLGGNGEALGAIVGIWQSDTTAGMSARSACAWGPDHRAVVCDQTVTGPAGEQHPTSLYTYDSAADRYVYYQMPRAGDTLRPVPLAIRGKMWTYGGTEVTPGETAYRTINEFVSPDRYTWRAESSDDGVHWTARLSGASRRVR